MSGPDPTEVFTEADAKERRSLAALVSLLTLGLVDNQLLGPIIPEIATSLQAAETSVGRTVVGYAIAAAMAGLTIGPLSDRFGRRGFLIGGGCAFALGSLLVVAARSFEAFVAARIVTGASAGIISALTVAAIADLVPYERRGRAMGWVAMAYVAAPTLGIVIVARVAEQAGWRTNYLIFTFAASLVAVSIGLWFDDVNGNGPARMPGYLHFMKSRSTAAGAFSAFFVTGGLTGFLLFLSLYLRTRFEFSLTTVSLVLALSGAASAVGALAAGRLSDRIGKLRVAIAGSVALSVFLIVVPETVGLTLYGALALVGLAAAARVAPLQSLMTQLVPKDERGAFVALRNTLSQCGNAVAAALTSALYDYGFHYICWLASAFTIAALILLLMIDEPAEESRA